MGNLQIFSNALHPPDMNTSNKIQAKIVGRQALKMRERCGWSQTDVCGWSGIEAPALCRIESGGRTASLEQLVRLARALRVTTDYLLGLK